MKKAGFLAACSAALVVACTTPTGGGGAGESPGALAGTSWRLVELQSSDDSIGTVRPTDTSRYTMELKADGSAAFQLDCNRGAGSWSSPGPGEITFTPLAMTRAMCPPGSLDTRIAREIGAVRTYVLVGDTLTLNMMASAGNLVWVRPSIQPTPR